MENGCIHTEDISQNRQLWKIHFGTLSTFSKSVLSFAQRLVSGHLSHNCYALWPRCLPPILRKTALEPPSFQQHECPLPSNLSVFCLAVSEPPVEGLNLLITHTTYLLVSSSTVSWSNLIPLVTKPGHRREQFALRPTGSGNTNRSTSLSWGAKPNSWVHLRSNTYIALNILDQIPCSSITFLHCSLQTYYFPF